MTAQGAQASRFVTDGLEAGYVWDPHPKSVGGKLIRTPLKDGWYEHAQNCLEYAELAAGQRPRSAQQVQRALAHAQHQALVRAQRDRDPADPIVRRAIRGGY